QRRHPGDFWVNHDLASWLLRLPPPRFDEAVRFYSAALALRPDNPAVQSNLGTALRGAGKLDDAVAAFRRAVHLKPDFAEAHTNLGSALMHLGKADEAVAACRRAIALKPNFAAAHTIAAFRRCIELNPTAAGAHINLGGALRRQGQSAESLAAYRRGHQLGAGNPRWPYPSAQWVQEGELLVKLDARLPAVLRGDE